MIKSTAPSVTRIALASFIGTAIEFYDFYIYGMAAALVIGPVFFPGGNPTTQALSAFLTFSVAFLTRPLGAMLFGHFGDRIGRKTTLVASLLVMGISTTLIGVLPGYDAIGAWAPALLCLLRFGQGIGLGGEWGGAALLATENAPAGKRGWYGMFPQLGPPVGFLLATGSFLLLAHFLSEQEFKDWGWRTSFPCQFGAGDDRFICASGLGRNPGVCQSVTAAPTGRLAASGNAKVSCRLVGVGSAGDGGMLCVVLYFYCVFPELRHHYVANSAAAISRHVVCGGAIYGRRHAAIGMGRRPIRTATRFADRRKRRIPVRFPVKADAGKRLTVDNYRFPVIGAIPNGSHLRADGSLAAGAVSLRVTLYRCGNRLQLRRYTRRFVCTLYRATSGHRGRAGLGRRLRLTGCGYQFAWRIPDARNP